MTTALKDPDIIHFNYIFCASYIHDEAFIQKISNEYQQALSEQEGRCYRISADGHIPPCIAQYEALLFFVLTGGVENEILELWKKREQFAPGLPVFLIAHPYHNSLPAALEVLARLQQDGVPGQIFYLESAEDAVGLKRLKQAIHGFNVRTEMANQRIGLIGESSPWLIASSPTPEVIRKVFGPEVVPVEMEELYHQMDIVSKEDAERVAAEFTTAIPEIREPSPYDLISSSRVYLALKALVEKHNLTALAVRCFDLVIKDKITGCLALSRLNDEGIIAGCESDMVSTIGMLWAYRLTGCLPWMANPAHIVAADNVLWLAHCTVPTKLVKNCVLRSHFESGLGVGVQGEFEKGPVTLLRLGGVDMRNIWLAEGMLLCSGNNPDLCRTQIQVKLDEKTPVTDLLNSPLGNHIVVIPGHHAEEIFTAWQSMITAR